MEITNWPKWNQDHDLRTKEINTLGALGKSKLSGYKQMELLKAYKQGERLYKEEKIQKGEYMKFLDRVIKQTKVKKASWKTFKNTPFDKLPEELKQEAAEDWASHNH